MVFFIFIQNLMGYSVSRQKDPDQMPFRSGTLVLMHVVFLIQKTSVWFIHQTILRLNELMIFCVIFRLFVFFEG